MNRYEAADPRTFLAGVECSIAKDHQGIVHYALVVHIDNYRHGIVAQVGSKEFSRDDMIGLTSMFWQELCKEGHIGHGVPMVGWDQSLVTLTGDPLMDAAQVAYAAAAESKKH